MRWLINKMHVSTPDEDIIELIFERAQIVGWHPLAAVAASERALSYHHENQAQYAQIVNGTF